MRIGPSITLQDTEEYLKLYSISGNHAIPMDFKIPIGQTFVGRVFAQSQLIICDDLAQSDELDCKRFPSMAWAPVWMRPMIHNGVCNGTLNVAIST